MCLVARGVCHHERNVRQGSHWFNHFGASENDDRSNLLRELAGKEKESCSSSKQGWQGPELYLLRLLSPGKRWEADFPGCRCKLGSSRIVRVGMCGKPGLTQRESVVSGALWYREDMKGGSHRLVPPTPSEQAKSSFCVCWGHLTTF